MSILTTFDISTYALDAYKNTIISSTDGTYDYSLDVFLFEDQAFSEWRTSFYGTEGYQEDEAGKVLAGNYSAYTVAYVWKMGLAQEEETSTTDDSSNSGSSDS